MGTAAVTRPVGAEGLPVTSGRDVQIADEPARFAHSVVHLMRDAGARQAIESAARKLVVERYDWSAVAHDFESALLKAAGLATGERAIA
jgi:glycosyltransferase involved in cell wall biosynthesis